MCIQTACVGGESVDDQTRIGRSCFGKLGGWRTRCRLNTLKQISIFQTVCALPVLLGKLGTGIHHHLIAFGTLSGAAFLIFEQHEFRAGNVSEIYLYHPLYQLIERCLHDSFVAVADVVRYLQTSGRAGVRAVFFGGLVLSEQRNADFGAAITDELVVGINR